MKIKVVLNKILRDDFRPALKTVMEKWTEAKDIFVLVKIANAIDAEIKAFSEAHKKLSEDLGCDIGGRKSVSFDEINNFLLSEGNGRVGPDGKLSMFGASDEDMKDYLHNINEAKGMIKKFNDAVEELVNTETEIEIPRLIKVTEKATRKAINPNECFILAPILDLTPLSSGETPAPEPEKED